MILSIFTFNLLDNLWGEINVLLLLHEKKTLFLDWVSEICGCMALVPLVTPVYKDTATLCLVCANNLQLCYYIIGMLNTRCGQSSWTKYNT